MTRPRWTRQEGFPCAATIDANHCGGNLVCVGQYLSMTDISHPALDGSLPQLVPMAGRALNAGDSAASLPVAVINETMGRQFWPDEDAIGKRFKIGPPESPNPWVTVVGVAADVKNLGLDVLTHWMKSLLFAIKPVRSGDVRSVSALLAAVALGPCYVPARRAMKADVVGLLR
jgi:hypothetical protein